MKSRLFCLRSHEHSKNQKQNTVRNHESKSVNVKLQRSRWRIPTVTTTNTTPRVTKQAETISNAAHPSLKDTYVEHCVPTAHADKDSTMHNCWHEA